MKTTEIREKSDADLITEIAARQRQLFALRTQTVTEKVEDTTQAGKIRRDIARIKTILGQRKMAPTVTA